MRSQRKSSAVNSEQINRGNERTDGRTDAQSLLPLSSPWMILEGTGSLALSMMMGSSLGPSANWPSGLRSLEHTSKPSIPGIITSSSTASGRRVGLLRKKSRHSKPFMLHR